MYPVAQVGLLQVTQCWGYKPEPLCWGLGCLCLTPTVLSSCVLGMLKLPQGLRWVCTSFLWRFTSPDRLKPVFPECFPLSFAHGGLSQCVYRPDHSGDRPASSS